MTNGLLVIALEKLFKEEPFNLERGKIEITMNYGSIEVEEVGTKPVKGQKSIIFEE